MIDMLYDAEGNIYTAIQLISHERLQRTPYGSLMCLIYAMSLSLLCCIWYCVVLESVIEKIGGTFNWSGP